jgi:hypothetical protein
MLGAIIYASVFASFTKVMVGLLEGVPMFLPVTLVAVMILGSVLDGISATSPFGVLLITIARQVGTLERHKAVLMNPRMKLRFFVLSFVASDAAVAVKQVHTGEVEPIGSDVIALLIEIIVMAAKPEILIE